VATGILSVGEIAPATRIILRKQKNAQVLLGDVVDIDLANKTVTSKLLDWERLTEFDSLIVAAGAQQSYFGNDHFEAFAPGMKTVDDALELRGRILERRLTFVGAGGSPAVQIPQQGQHGDGVAVQRGVPGRQARVRRIPCLAGVAGPAPLLPRGQP
jgi:hypothetical protein